jgi:sigma-B regulation protein RsbU (phosphoserine phosphatase)
VLDTPHVQLIVNENPVPPPLQTALNRLKARVTIRSFNRALDKGVSSSADVCVILDDSQQSSDVLDLILNDASDRACATLVLPTESHTGQDATGKLIEQHPILLDKLNKPSSLNTDELMGRLKALCEIRRPLKKMHDELIELRERDALLSNGMEEILDQLHLAGVVQNDLLAESLIDTEPLTVSTLFLPADHVSGDIYDISQLDGDRLSFSLADATGHGLPAALLTTLIKNSLSRKDIRIIEPNDLLEQLNRELLDTNLTHCQFITVLNAIFDRKSGLIRWCRGGTPYPILLRPGELPRQIRSGGGLIGATASSEFEVATHDFEPGDALLFFTDGLESLLLGKESNYGDEGIVETPWLEYLAINGAEAGLAAIRTIAAQTPEDEWYKDDITAMILKMN